MSLPEKKSMKPNDCLQTPEWVWRKLGPIDLDPCAGQSTFIGRCNFALEHGFDGLLDDWSGFVYCNPPFSQKEAWIKKMIRHGNGILLLPERGSAPWFGPLANATGRYWVMGRKINFVGGSSSNNLGSVLFPFGQEAARRLLNSGLPGHFVEVKQFVPREMEVVPAIKKMQHGGVDAADIPQPDWGDVFAAYVAGAEAARAHPAASAVIFRKSADAHCKLLHAQKDSQSFDAFLQSPQIS